MLVVVSLCAPAVFGELKAHYTFDDGTANDSSGNGAHAQLQGNAKVVEDTDLVPGEVFYVMEVSGGDDVLVTPGLTVQEKVPTLTFAAWIKPREETFEGDRRSSLISHKVVPWVDGTIHFMLRYRALAFSVKYDTPASLAGTIEFEADQWYHVAVVRDGTDMIAYVNGQEDTRVTGTREITFKDGFNIGAHANASRQFYGRMEDIRIYDHALTAEELLAIALAPFPKLELAAGPNPVNGETGVARDAQLSWTPGEGADQHDVYIGTNFDDVNNATTTDDPAGVYKGQQEATNYTPGRLEFGQTYYWRVDEVKVVDGTFSKGPVWGFTVEPVGYALSGELITATASSSADPNGGPVNTINGSGLDDNDLHSVEQPDMWLSSSTGQQPTWVEYEFDRVYKLHEMQVWNHNSFLERVVGFGIKDATVEYSADGVSWTTVGTTHEFARASSAAGYAANTIVDLSGVVAKYIKITANSNWGSLPQYGLSEVRFLYVPVLATGPDPASGATDMDVDNVTLRWRAGREAASHDVYLSTNEQAVIDETISPVSVSVDNSYASYDAGTLDLGQTYYWKINEVNEAETPATWQGDVSNFSTREYLLVDDFEAYDANDNQIWFTWHDGLGYGTLGTEPYSVGNGTGSMVGDETTPSYMEETIVHGGGKSMPVFYDNSILRYSEVEKTLTYPRDWTENGVNKLSICFRGILDNAAETLYVVLNGSAVVTHDNPNAAQIDKWTEWTIDLQTFGVNLANVNTIGLGLGDRNNPQAGGSGVMYFDDIRLYPPAQPEAPEGLIGLWNFDEGSGAVAGDSSGNGLDGAISGAAWVSPGADGAGSALDFDGQGSNRVSLGTFDVVGDGLTIAMWCKADNLDTPGNDPRLFSKAIGGNNDQHWFMISSGRQGSSKVFRFRLKTDGTTGELKANTETGLIDLDVWTHVAAVWDGAAMRLYKNGEEVGSLEKGGTLSTNPDAKVSIGNQPEGIGGDRPWDGQIDDVRLYNRALSVDEISELAVL